MRASSLAMLALPAVLAIPPQLREQVRGKEDELSAPAVKPMGDLARPDADWRMTTTEFLGKAPKQECFSISAGATSEWCQTNCGLEVPNCPQTLCSCEDPNAPKKVVRRKLPEGPLIVGYMNYGECDDRVDQAIKDGVNVVIWFSLELENRGEPLITSAVSPVCVQTAVQRLKEAGLNAAHLISVGGWGVPHPDTAFSGAEWYKQFTRWNNAASGPGFENGFDGIDWDLTLTLTRHRLGPGGHGRLVVGHQQLHGGQDQADRRLLQAREEGRLHHEHRAAAVVPRRGHLRVLDEADAQG